MNDSLGLGGRTEATPTWLTQLRKLHEQALDFDWESHLAQLNARPELTSRSELSTAQNGAPPAWFNGDVEAISNTRWVLVMSLNPQKPPEGHYKGLLTPETAWDFWRTHNSDFWYGRFFRPLVRLASQAIDEAIPSRGDAEREFATKRMVFVELCPYASQGFDLKGRTLHALIENDPGFRIAREVRQVLIDEARPTLILVNGNDAVDEISKFASENLEWVRKDYELPTESGGTKSAWHYEGVHQSKYGLIPTFGFKFLNKPQNHNGNADIDDLAFQIRSFSTVTKS